MTPAYARTIGIAVDHRRTNRCHESLNRNVARLEDYKKKVKELGKDSQMATKDVTAMPARELREKKQAITEEMKKYQVYQDIKQKRADKKHEGKRNKKLRQKERKRQKNKEKMEALM